MFVVVILVFVAVVVEIVVVVVAVAVVVAVHFSCQKHAHSGQVLLREGAHRHANEMKTERRGRGAGGGVRRLVESLYERPAFANMLMTLSMAPTVATCVLGGQSPTLEIATLEPELPKGASFTTLALKR